MRYDGDYVKQYRSEDRDNPPSILVHDGSLCSDILQYVPRVRSEPGVEASREEIVNPVWALTTTWKIQVSRYLM